jgi:DNA (cytosine-5)-methyltransferase 1
LYETVAFCEVDEYCKQLLQKHWKGVKIYNDIKNLKGKDLEETHGRIDIVCGGFPCQPYSVAGKQKGTNDDRYLWPEMFRVITEVQPRWVVAENVRGIVNIQDGMVFERVCSDLESQGYQVQPFNIPAAGVGAPHQRERIWIVGHSKHYGSLASEIKGRHTQDDARSTEGENQTIESERTSGSRNNEALENTRRTLRQGASIGEKNENEIREEDANKFERSGETPASVMANTESIGSRESREFDQTQGSAKSNATQLNGSSANGAHSNIEGSQRFGSKHELSEGERETPISWPRRWEFEPDVGRVANGVQGRVHRLKALGNSIIPQIAEEIARAIGKAEYEKN